MRTEKIINYGCIVLSDLAVNTQYRHLEKVIWTSSENFYVHVLNIFQVEKGLLNQVIYVYMYVYKLF